MDENQNVTEDEKIVPSEKNDTPQEAEVAVNKSKTSTIAHRSIVMIFLQISNIAFCVCMGYLLFSFISTTLGVDLSSFIGGPISQFTLGLSSALGIFVYVLFFLIATLIVGLAIGFVSVNNKYFKVLKAANEHKLEVLLAPLQTTSSFISMFLVLGILLFLSIAFITNSMFSLPVIFFIIATAALLAALGLAIALCISNRVKYRKLSDVDKIIVKEQSKAFAKTETKKERDKERKRRVGKLY